MGLFEDLITDANLHPTQDLEDVIQNIAYSHRWLGELADETRDLDTNDLVKAIEHAAYAISGELRLLTVATLISANRE